MWFSGRRGLSQAGFSCVMLLIMHCSLCQVMVTPHQDSTHHDIPTCMSLRGAGGTLPTPSLLAGLRGKLTRAGSREEQGSDGARNPVLDMASMVCLSSCLRGGGLSNRDALLRKSKERTAKKALRERIDRNKASHTACRRAYFRCPVLTQRMVVPGCYQVLQVASFL